MSVLGLGWCLYWGWVGVCTGGGLVSVPGWVGVCTGAGLVSVPGLGWCLYWGWVGVCTGAGLVSVLGLGWCLYWGWVGVCTGAGLVSMYVEVFIHRLYHTLFFRLVCNAFGVLGNYCLSAAQPKVREH